MTDEKGRTQILSAESGYRSLFGDRRQRVFRGALITGVTVTVIATLTARIPGLIIGLLLTGILALLTSPSVTGALVDKWITRYRQLWRRMKGLDRFIPYSDRAWQQAMATENPVLRRRALRAVRVMPDGADGMGWLISAPNEVGVAWHAPMGSEPYMSVAYEIGGRMNGFESLPAINRATEAWGTFLGSLGGELSLARYVQTLTRLLPPDTARHEQWVSENVDPAIAEPGSNGEVLLESYEDVLAQLSEHGLIQRHFVIIRWPIDRLYKQTAERYGKGHEGERQLMALEAQSMLRRLEQGGVGSVRALTARQVAAMIRHQQNPAIPLDQAGDVDPMNFGVEGRDLRAMHTTVFERKDTETIEWFHATARIQAEYMTIQERGGFWVIPWLTGLSEPVIRSMSWHMRIIPAEQARAQARVDQTRDLAELQEALEKGRLAGDGLEAKRAAAARRLQELAPGTENHGVEWMGFITITGADEDELRRHARLVAERAQVSMGINRLEWCEGFQSVATGYTWPIARGIEDQKGDDIGTKMQRFITGTDTKESLA